MKKRRIICILLCLVLLLTACTKPGPQDEAAAPTGTAAPAVVPTPTPTAAPAEEPISFAEAYLMLAEPEAFGRLIDTYALKSEYRGTVYWLSQKLADRDDLVRQQASLLEALARLGYDTSNLTVYILSKGSTYSDAENRAVHLNPDAVGTPEAIRATLGAILGDYTNGGYLYALSRHIGGQEAEEEEPDPGVFRDAPALLNLVAPCFSDRYANEGQLTACRALARKVLNAMEDPYAGEEAFLAGIRSYAREIGVTFVPTTVKYAYNSETCPVRVQTCDLVVYISSDYKAFAPSFADGEPYDPLFTADAMIRFFDEVDQLTRELRTLFQVDREEYLTVRFTDTYEDGSGGQTGGIFYYKNERNKGIIARKFDALRHEYVHYLYACRVDVDGAEHVQWCNEALAYWYGQADNYAYFRLAYRVDEAARWYFETLLGQPFDAPEDYVAFCILNAREILDSQGRNMLRYDLMKDLGGYKEAFGAYFIETYGEQTFIDCMLAPSLTEARCGKVLEDIVEDWMDALPELNEVQRALLSETDM